METPAQVKKTFERLKLEYPYYISLAKINGKFYVYKSKSFWDKEAHRVRTEKTYLGRIDEQGTFIKRKEYEEKVVQVDESKEIDEIDNKILMHLSMNCRIPLAIIAKRTGISLQAVERRKKSLEKRFGIRYFASINYTKLGFSEFVILVKFLEDKPTNEEIEKVFENEPRVQLVMTMQGEYDLFAYLLAEDAFVLDGIIYNIRKNERLSRYKAVWNSVVLKSGYGYIPLRDKFFDLIEKKVWHRTKETPRPASDSITQREYILLRELNADGNIPFAEIEKKHNLGNGAARYTFDKLKEKGLISSETLTMSTCGARYNAAIEVDVLNMAEFIEDRRKFIRYIIKDYNEPVNRFSFEGDTFSPDGSLFIIPIFKDGELEEEKEWLNQQIKGIKIKSMIFTKTILGELCYRKFDNNYSGQMHTLVSEYKEEPPKDMIDYQEFKISYKK